MIPPFSYPFLELLTEILTIGFALPVFLVQVIRARYQSKVLHPSYLLIVPALVVLVLAPRLGHQWLSPSLTMLSFTVLGASLVHFLKTPASQALREKGKFLPFLVIGLVLLSIGSTLQILAMLVALPGDMFRLAGWIASMVGIMLVLVLMVMVSESLIQSHISSSHEYRGRLTFLAEHDPVTGLLNRHALSSLLAELCRTHGTSTVHPGVFCLDLDHFSAVNSLLGTDEADKILQMVAERLTIFSGDANMVFRLGGDEFAFVDESAGSELASAMLAESLLKLFVRPFCIGEHEIYLTTSMGITFIEGDLEADQVLDQAMGALSAAKEDRNTYRMHQRDLSHASREKIRYLNSLRHAISGGELSLAFQPQVGPDGSLLGAEALVRWNSPEYGEVPPGVFIPIAEESGLIISLGEWVIENAARAQAELIQKGVRIPLAVNLSARQLRDKRLEKTLVGILKKYQIPYELFHLEITESSVFSDKGESMDIIWNLRNLGFHFCIDDFGTGYGSLTYLKTLPVHTVKIDRSFISGLPANPQDAAVVNAVLGIAKGLGLRVVAEGVEASMQAEYLKDQDCAVLQGFYYSRPLDLGTFMEFASRAP